MSGGGAFYLHLHESYAYEERDEAASAVEGPKALIAIAKKMVALAISSDPYCTGCPWPPAGTQKSPSVADEPTECTLLAS